MSDGLAPALAPYVASLVAYDVDLGAHGVHRGLPSSTLTLVLPVGEPLDVGWAGRAASRGRRWSTVSGLHVGPAVIHHPGHQRGVQVALTLMGARALLGLPAAALAGALVELDDLGDTSLRHLPERLADADPRHWSDLVQRSLLAALARHGAPGPAGAVSRAMARLTRGAPVRQVADEVGYSRRHLATLVRSETGVSPSDLRRVGRFERSRAVLGHRATVAEVAGECGYADHAHLTRDWVALAGCTPSTWLREEFPFVQDVGEDAAAG
jgi:AraC-like DNA-binding protein